MNEEMKNLYGLAGDISSAICLPEKFYFAMFDLLIPYDGLHFLLNEANILNALKEDMRGEHMRRKDKRPRHVYGVKGLTAFFVLKHIVFRTLRFRKILEAVQPKQVVSGMPQLNVPPCGISAQTIYRTLWALSAPRSDCLIRLKLTPTSKEVTAKVGKKYITAIYGLNIPPILDALKTVLEARLQDIYPKKDWEAVLPKLSLWTRRQLILVDACRDFIDHFRPAFKFLEKSPRQIFYLDDFGEKLRSKCPSSKDLSYGPLDEFHVQFDKAKKLRVYRPELPANPYEIAQAQIGENKQKQNFERRQSKRKRKPKQEVMNF